MAVKTSDHKPVSSLLLAGVRSQSWDRLCPEFLNSLPSWKGAAFENSVKLVSGKAAKFPSFFFFFLSPQIKRINSEAYKRTFEEIVRNIDKMENECIPSVTLSKQEVASVRRQPHRRVTLNTSVNLNPFLGLIETFLFIYFFAPVPL